MNNLRTYLQKIRTVSHNLQTLCLDLYQTQPKTVNDTRQLLLRAANDYTNPNNVARSFLVMDKEWNLMKYMGIKSYLHLLLRPSWNRIVNNMNSSNIISPFRQWKSNSIRYDNDDHDHHTTTTQHYTHHTQHTRSNQHHPTDSDDIPIDTHTKQRKVAVVPFMITSAQKHQLRMELHYTSEQIRRFKPMEALLLIEHDISAKNEDWEEKLENLLNTNDNNNNNNNNNQERIEILSTNPTINTGSNDDSHQQKIHNNTQSKMNMETNSELDRQTDLDMHVHTNTFSDSNQDLERINDYKKNYSLVIQNTNSNSSGNGSSSTSTPTTTTTSNQLVLMEKEADGDELYLDNTTKTHTTKL
mmetsp:Transcript_4697/g.6672  ORF Transcript_4697/g.6672 Transcript_4697/m.6672 type:complete len:357 (+) Transcript_4697:180-1250(+)